MFRFQPIYLTTQLLLPLLFIIPIIQFDASPFWLLGTIGMLAFRTIVLVESFMHRFCTHRSYKLSKYTETILAWLCTAISGNGSILTWSMIHAQHHKFPDTKKDPHSPENIKLVQFLLVRFTNKGDVITTRHLLKNKMYLFLHEYYLAIEILWCLIISLFFGFVGLYFLVLLPWSLGQLNSALVNYVGHSKGNFGYRNFDTPDLSKNSFIMQLLSFFAVGLHNNHHNNPNLWFNNFIPGEIDTAGLVIKNIRLKD